MMTPHKSLRKKKLTPKVVEMTIKQVRAICDARERVIESAIAFRNCWSGTTTEVNKCWDEHWKAVDSLQKLRSK